MTTTLPEHVQALFDTLASFGDRDGGGPARAVHDLLHEVCVEVYGRPRLPGAAPGTDALSAIADHGYDSARFSSLPELSRIMDWMVDTARAGLAGDPLPELTESLPGAALGCADVTDPENVKLSPSRRPAFPWGTQGPREALMLTELWDALHREASKRGNWGEAVAQVEVQRRVTEGGSQAPSDGVRERVKAIADQLDGEASEGGGWTLADVASRLRDALGGGS